MGKLLVSAPFFSITILLVAAAEVSAEQPAEEVGLMAWLTPLFIIAFLIVLNGLYVMSEFAIIGVRPSQMEELANQGNTRAERVLEIVQSPREQDRYIATAQLGITIASLGLGMYAEPAIAHLIEPYLEAWLGVTDAGTLHTITYVLVLGSMTYLHVVVGEMVPKSLALSDAARMVMWVSAPMRISQLVLTPLVTGLNSIGGVLLKLLRLPPPQARVHSPEEIELIVSESAAGGLLNAEEREIIRKIFDFGDRRVGQVMTPRPKVSAIPTDMACDDIMKLVADSPYTRFPVYEEDRDHIVGIVHMRDLITYRLEGKQDFNIRALMGERVPAVPEYTLVEDLLATMKRQHIHMAVVLDEAGGMAGVVTLEDLVEEVVGEVYDEFDNERAPIEHTEPGMIEVAGNYLLEELQDQVSLDGKDFLPDVETVGGLVVTRLGRPPQTGDEIEVNGVTMAVLAVDGRAVSRISVRYLGGDDLPQSSTVVEEDAH